MVGDMAAGTDELPHRGSTLQVRPAAITDPAADKRQPTADAGGQLELGPYGPGCVAHRLQPLILIDAPFSP